jgi:repressor LexA
MIVGRDNQAHAALQLIEKSVRERGYPPSRSEIAEHLGMAAKGSTQPVIERMKEQGLIRVERHSPRAITITEAGMKALTEGV